MIQTNPDDYELRTYYIDRNIERGGHSFTRIHKTCFYQGRELGGVKCYVETSNTWFGRPVKAVLTGYAGALIHEIFKDPKCNPLVELENRVIELHRMGALATAKPTAEI